jgi:hypothetical protein
VNGKPAVVLSWQYTPETTFGYPLPAGYEFDVAKDGTRLALNPSNELSFLDTNGETGHEYEVTVFSGNYQSITDSVANGNSAVSAEETYPSTFHFLNSPAIAGLEDDLVLDCTKACRISLTFYDALGRKIGPAVSDNIFAPHHAVAFVPDDAGVRFFALREYLESGDKEMFGKLLVKQQ